MDKLALENSGLADWENQDSKKEGSYEGLFNELGKGFNGMFENGKCQKRNRAVAYGFNHFEESGSKLHVKRLKESRDDNGVEMSSDVNDKSEEEGLDLSWKKEGGDLRGMMKWLTLVAKSPDDPSIGVIPYCSKWRKYNGKEVCIQAIRAKNALLVQRDNAGIGYRNSPILDFYTVHPSMYDDVRKSIGRSRYSLRDKKVSQNSANGSWVSQTKSRTYKRAARVTTTYKATGVVPVGPGYQARIDQWTESRLGSDDKWLGTRIWPSENNEALDQTLGNDLIGKGRPTSCSCDFPNSVECVRFHIAEKRMELKGDIGNAFFHLRFNRMGEEECLSWTESEEKKFKDMMISDPDSFWRKAVRCFKQKKRVELVRYYFNVFLINKRRYQNRATPRDIDSDSDEPFGAVGNRFGQDAVTSSVSNGMICSLNRQCEDYGSTGTERK